MAVSILFFFLAAAAIMGALGAILSRNPVTSALWLISNLLAIAALYLTLNAAFIAAVQVLVYAGAIMILFVFVIMLLNLAVRPGLREISFNQGAAYLLVVVVLAQLVYIIASSFEGGFESATLADAVETGSASFLAKELFTRYVIPFEMIGVLLLAATIGAVVLARRADLIPEEISENAD
jgi:NADH-quinone oxidoreductase subunit J